MKLPHSPDARPVYVQVVLVSAPSTTHLAPTFSAVASRFVNRYFLQMLAAIRRIVLNALLASLIHLQHNMLLPPARPPPVWHPPVPRGECGLVEKVTAQMGTPAAFPASQASFSRRLLSTPAETKTQCRCLPLRDPPSTVRDFLFSAAQPFCQMIAPVFFLIMALTPEHKMPGRTFCHRLSQGLAGIILLYGLLALQHGIRNGNGRKQGAFVFGLSSDAGKASSVSASSTSFPCGIHTHTMTDQTDHRTVSWAINNRENGFSFCSRLRQRHDLGPGNWKCRRRGDGLIPATMSPGCSRKAPGNGNPLPLAAGKRPRKSPERKSTDSPTFFQQGFQTLPEAGRLALSSLDPQRLQNASAPPSSADSAKPPPILRKIICISFFGFPWNRTSPFCRPVNSRRSAGPPWIFHIRSPPPDRIPSPFLGLCAKGNIIHRPDRQASGHGCGNIL